MSRVNLGIHLQMEEADLASFLNCDVMVAPHLPAERATLLANMATVERCVEATGDAEAVKAFQWLGGFLARAKYAEGTILARGPAGRRFNA